MVFRRLSLISAAVGIALGVPAAANATAVVTIDDLTDIIGGTASGVSNLSQQLTDEAPGVLGGADFAFEYFSDDPNAPAPGAQILQNYNIFEPNSDILSDTLSISIVGHTPTGPDDNNNVSVDIHFRSDSSDEIPPVALADATALFETGDYQLVDSGLSDLSVSFRSDVETPEPLTISLLGAGLFGVAGARLRKRAKT